MVDDNSDKLDQMALETLFPAVAKALDTNSDDRKTLVITKAFFLLAYRTGALETAVAALEEASADPRRDAE